MSSSSSSDCSPSARRCIRRGVTGATSIEVVTLHDFTGMSRDDWKRSWKPWLRGTAIGFPLGVLPCGGSVIPTFLSYMVEKRLSEHPEEFGHGAIEGVAGPEAANNAAAAGVLVPLLTLGLPSSATAAIMLAGVSAVRAAAGPAAVRVAARSRLDADCQPVHRQRDAAGPEPAARRRVGAGHAGAAAAALRRASWCSRRSARTA